MNKRFLYLLPLLALFAYVGVASASTERDTIKRSFSVEPGGTLFIDIDRGNVVLEASPDHAVYVELERTVRGTGDDDMKDMLARHEWSIDNRGNDVTVESRYDRDGSRRGWRNGDGFRLKVTVRVPERYNLDFQTGAGNVTISDLAGSVDGRTGAGNIEVGEVRGDVEIRSGSGNISLEGVEGELRVTSGAGNIRLGYVAGLIRATTGAGNVTARITDQPRQDSYLESGAGNVSVYLKDEYGLDVDAKASVGSADCDFGLRVEGKWMSKSFEGSINGGGPALTLRSGVGNVSLLRM